MSADAVTVDLKFSRVRLRTGVRTRIMLPNKRLREITSENRGLMRGIARHTRWPGLEFVIDAYYHLWRIEKAFRMSKARPAGPPDLPPLPRLHRSPPQRGVRSDGRIALDRTPNRLERREIRTHRTPLPHRHHPSRQPNPDRRLNHSGRSRRSPRQNPRRTCALVCYQITTNRPATEGRLSTVH